MPILDFTSVVADGTLGTGDITEIKVVNAANQAPGLSVWSSVVTPLRVVEDTTEYTLKDVVFTTDIGETLTVSSTGSVTYSGADDWTTLASDGILCNIDTSGVLSPDVDSQDSVNVLKHIVHLDPINSNTYNWYATDVNNDGHIRAGDSSAILQQVTSLAGIITPPNPTLMIKEISGNYYVIVRGDTDSGSTWASANKGDIS